MTAKSMGHTAKYNGKGTRSRGQNDSLLPNGKSCAGSMREETNLKKGPWTSEEDEKLKEYVKTHGEGNWNAVQKYAGLYRCGKSCRLRWANHLRPNLKKGAFSQEEEKLIIELHAKMGNRWARMASYLPGRTDNEIKNYWNTRIKRRQRAGLPVYPPGVKQEALPVEQSYDKTSIFSGDPMQQNVFETKFSDMADALYGNSRGTLGALASLPELPDTTTGVVSKGMVSSRCCDFMSFSMHCPKSLPDPTFFPLGCCDSIAAELQSFQHLQGGSEDFSRSLGLSSPYDLDSILKNPLPFEAAQGSQTLLNCNFPTSKPTVEAMKLELPSFQYPEAEWNIPSPPALYEPVDTFIQSPLPTGTVQQSDSAPLCDSGLLDVLVNEARARCTNNCSHASHKSFSPTTCGVAGINTPGISEAQFNASGSPYYTLGGFAFNEYPGRGNSLEGSDPVFDGLTGNHVNSDGNEDGRGSFSDDGSAVLDPLTEYMHTSDWADHIPGSMNDTTTMADAVSALLAEDQYDFYAQKVVEAPSTQEWGLESFAWRNMPGTCSVPSFPEAFS